jgi:hypothetical protein
MGTEIYLGGSVHIGYAAFQTITALHTCEDLQHPEWSHFLLNRAQIWAYDVKARRFSFALEGKLWLDDVERFLDLVAYLVDEDVISAVEYCMDVDQCYWELVRAGMRGIAPTDWTPDDAERDLNAIAWDVRWRLVGPVLERFEVEDLNLICTTLRGRTFEVYRWSVPELCRLDEDEHARGRLEWFGSRLSFPDEDSEITIDAAKLFERREQPEPEPELDIDAHATNIELRGQVRISADAYGCLDALCPKIETPGDGSASLRARAERWRFYPEIPRFEFVLVGLSGLEVRMFLDVLAHLEDTVLVDTITASCEAFEGRCFVSAGRRAWVRSEPFPGTVIDIHEWIEIPPPLLRIEPGSWNESLTCMTIRGLEYESDPYRVIKDTDELTIDGRYHTRARALGSEVLVPKETGGELAISSAALWTFREADPSWYRANR